MLPQFAKLLSRVISKKTACLQILGEQLSDKSLSDKKIGIHLPSDPPSDGSWILWTVTAEDNTPETNALVTIMICGTRDSTKAIPLLESAEETANPGIKKKSEILARTNRKLKQNDAKNVNVLKPKRFRNGAFDKFNVGITVLFNTDKIK